MELLVSTCDAAPQFSAHLRHQRCPSTRPTRRARPTVCCHAISDNAVSEDLAPATCRRRCMSEFAILLALVRAQGLGAGRARLRAAHDGREEERDREAARECVQTAVRSRPCEVTSRLAPLQKRFSQISRNLRRLPPFRMLTSLPFRSGDLPVSVTPRCPTLLIYPCSDRRAGRLGWWDGKRPNLKR